MNKRPNILFCCADDASHFSIDGSKFVNTPHIDSIGHRGIHFKSMFTTNPKCAPSRASLLTGMHTWQLQEAVNHWNVFPGPDELTVYPDILENNGYHVGYTGKGWAPGDYQRKGRKRNPAGPEYNQLTHQTPDSSCISPIDYVSNFEVFLNERDENQPFCFWFGCLEPHRPYSKGEGARHGKQPNAIKEVPPYWPDTEAVREDMADYAFEVEWFDTQVGKMVQILQERHELDNTLVIVTSDNGCPFPRVKGNMYEDDFRLPFVAMWNDQFKNMGSTDALCSFTDIAPTFVEIAGLDPSSYDFFGRSLTDVFKGKPIHRDRVMMGRERHDMGREGDVGYPVRCLRTPEYLYVRNLKPDRWPAGNPETGYTDCDSSPTKEEVLKGDSSQSQSYQWCFGKRPPEELYRIQDDPHCIHNLAEVESHKKIKNQLWQELQQGLTASHDPRVLGQAENFDVVEYVGPCLHSWKNYLKGDWQPQVY